MLSIAQIIDIAKISQYLSSNAIAKSGLLGGGIDILLPRKLYNIRKSVEWANVQTGISSQSLRATANYLFSLCAPFSTQAIVILNTGGGGSISPIVPSSGYGYYELETYVGGLPNQPIAGQFTYQNDIMIGAKDFRFFILNNTLLSIANGDFSFDSVTGIVSVITNAWQSNDTMLFPFNRKL